MGLLDNQTQNSYYNNSSNFGNYQFTSLEDIINQFLVVYVGEGKIIQKADRVDVAFHAQRAMQELSFDTFKSIKSQEIELPPSNTMILPHDYVNYTRVLWTDAAGIKRPLYPTKHTQNPFKIKQDDNGNYDFANLTQGVLIKNSDFSSALSSDNWLHSDARNTKDENSAAVGTDVVGASNGELIFTNFYDTRIGTTNEYFSHQYAVWQSIELDANATELNLSADGLSTAASGANKEIGILRVGISTVVHTYPNGLSAQQTGSIYSENTGYDPGRTNPKLPTKPSLNMDTNVFDLSSPNSGTLGSYIEFNSGNNTLTSATPIFVDVSDVPLNSNGKKQVYILIVSDNRIISNGVSTTSFTQKVDNIKLLVDGISSELIEGGESTTWSNYKSENPSENQQHDYDYDDHIFEANIGRRYGLNPAHAQDNGSYYIDNLRGKIHFSSNLSGQTIVLDYISDSLGTDSEMQVHKFAEEAMYKYILHAIASGSLMTQQVVPRLKKEKFAAIRQAKLRLSNIKLEEITQILRGKSKWIKH